MMNESGAAARDLLRAFLSAVEKDDVGAAVARMLATARAECPEVLEECSGGVWKLEWWLEDCADYDIRELMPNLPPATPRRSTTRRETTSRAGRAQAAGGSQRACRRTTRTETGADRVRGGPSCRAARALGGALRLRLPIRRRTAGRHGSLATLKNQSALLAKCHAAADNASRTPRLSDEGHGHFASSAC